MQKQLVSKSSEKQSFVLDRRVYDLQFKWKRSAFPGVLVRSEGDPPCGDDAVDKCYENLGIVHDFLSSILRRDSIDGKGMPLIGIVHYGIHYPGAFWNIKTDTKCGQCMTCGDGWETDKEKEGAPKQSFAGFFGNFVGSLEVVAHEMMHGVTQFIANGLDYIGEPGALLEHFADVFGILVEQWYEKQSVEEADWLVGEDLLMPDRKGLALRSMKAPGTAYHFPELVAIGRDEQVGHMKDFKVLPKEHDAGGVHINSGIPNRAFYLVAMKLGGYAWERAGKIWWTALNDGTLPPHCKFKDWAYFTVKAAHSQFGEEVGSLVNEAWKDVGVR